MKRKEVEAAKTEARRFLERVDVMERCAGWTRYTLDGNQATSKPNPDDTFNGGEYTAAVKRASMDLTRALAVIRR